MVERAPFVDVHCHLLSGLDDGPRTLADAIAMCRLAYDDGTGAFAATAHQLGDYAKVTRSRILEATARLAKELKALGIPARVFPSAEWMINAEWVERGGIEDCDLVTINDGNKYALIEFPYHPPHHTGLIAARFAARGLTPVLAHVDRYPSLLRDPRATGRLIDEGFLIQLNGSALEGARGTGVRRAASGLVLRGLVHIVASDAHDPIRRTPRLAGAYSVAQRLVGGPAARLLFTDNPMALLEGRPTRPLRPASRIRQLARWFW